MTQKRYPIIDVFKLLLICQSWVTNGVFGCRESTYSIEMHREPIYQI
jgi:hypothetical protein